MQWKFSVLEAIFEFLILGRLSLILENYLEQNCKSTFYKWASLFDLLLDNCQIRMSILVTCQEKNDPVVVKGLFLIF